MTRKGQRWGREFWAVTLIAVFAGCMAMIFASAAFPRGAPDLDETAYRAQSSALLAGHLTLPGSYSPSFLPFLSGLRAGRVVFKYQPAWPALMAVSQGAFGSTLPLRFALAALGVIVVYGLANELFGDRRLALVAALIVAFSPFLWVQAATDLGYQLTFVTGIGAAWLLVRWSRRRSRGVAIAAGAVAGLAVMHRPYDALIVLTPVLAWVLWSAWRRADIVALARDLAVGAAPFVVLLAAYNQAVMGRPWRFAYGVSGSVDRFGFGWRASFTVPHTGRGGMIHYTVGQALSATWANAAALPRFVMAAPLVIAAAIYTCVRQRAAWQTRLLLGMIVAVFAGYFLWWGTANAVHFGLHITLGPVYHYVVLAPIAILAASCCVQLVRTRRAAIVVVGVALLWCLPASWNAFRNARHAGRTPAAELARTDAPGRRLVFETAPFRNDPYLSIDNRADLGGDRVVALDVPGERLHVIDRFPGRAYYLVRQYRRLGDFLGQQQSDRVQLHISRAPRIRFAITDRVYPNSVAYVKVGKKRLTPVAGSAGSDGHFDLTRAELPADGSVATVAVGLASGRTGDDSWVECRFEARATTTGVELLEPCDGYQQYVFPNGRKATSREDTTPRLSIHTSSSTATA